MAGKMQLNLGTLGELRGGLVGKIFEQKLSAVIGDCADRPGNKAARKLTLDVMVSPTEEDQAGDKVDIEVQITAKVPAQMIKAHQARVSKSRDRATGRDQFHAVVGGDPDDADQMVLGEDKK